MARRVNTTVHVLHGFSVATLRAGDEVPDWAEAQVAAELTDPTKVEAPKDPEPEPKRVDPAPTTPAPVKGGPDESWTNAQIRKHAEAAGVDLGGATTKGDMLAVLRDA